MMQQSAGADWRITSEERAKHDAQFFQLKPINGFVSGQNARQFFLQCNLPPTVLGQIWELADFNKDGRLDKLEFSIAMYLIKKKLEGKELPSTLPKSLMLQPAAVPAAMPVAMPGYGGTQFPGMMGPVQGMAPMQPPGSFPGVAPGTVPGYMAGAGFQQPGMATPLARAGTLPAQSAVVPAPSPERSKSVAVSPEWAIPQGSKLKYKQQFNQVDRMKSGFIMGLQARSILMQSGLPQNVLAQIWTLSDINSDGKLTSDEFVVAMHLVDLAKSGQALPMSLPPEMVPPSFRRAGRSGSFTSVGGAVGMPPPAVMSLPNMMPQAQMPVGAMAAPMSPSLIPKQESGGEPQEEFKMPASFEDRKKQNFDKGQQELQRRRALLEEERQKEKERQLEIERREHEKRERARLEQERRKQMEMEKMLARQREVEAEQEQQRQRMIEQREAARREMERQRQMDIERQRKQELDAMRIKSQGDVAHLKAKSKTLLCEMENLDDKKNLMMKELSVSRNKVTEVNTNMILMGQSRDSKVADIEKIQFSIQESRQRKLKLDNERAELTEAAKRFADENPMSDTYKTVMNSYNQKKLACEQLNKSVDEVEKETAKTLESIDESNAKLAELKQVLAREEAELRRLQEVHRSKVTQYQHTKVNIQNQKLEEVNDKPVVSQAPSLQGSKPSEDPFAAFREVQAEDERKRQEAEKVTTATAPSAGGDPFPAFGSAKDPFAAAGSADPFASAGAPDSSKPADPSDPFSAFGGKSETKAAEPEGKKDAFADFASFGSFDFGSKSSQPKPVVPNTASTSLFSAKEEPPKESNKFEANFDALSGAFADTTHSSASQGKSQDSGKDVNKFEANFDGLSGAFADTSQSSVPQAKAQDSSEDPNKFEANFDAFSTATQPSPASQLKTQESKEKPKEAPRFEANFDAFSGAGAASVGTTQAAIKPTDATPARQEEGRKDTVPSFTSKINMMAIDTSVPLPEHLRSVLARYRAVFDFKAESEDELSFKKGDIILVGKKQDAEPGWLGGELRGQTGWFPENHVEKLPSAPTSPVSNGPTKKPWNVKKQEKQEPLKATEEQKPSVGQMEATRVEAQSGSPFSQVGMVTPAAQQQTEPAQTKPPLNLRVEAISDFEAKEDNHLSFKAGDLVTVSEKQEMWWAGELNGKTGWFPGNLVKEAGTPHLVPSVSVTSVAADESVEYEAVYAYTSAEAGDLQFSTGDTILVTRKDGEWWRGKIGDREGDFPSNYVKPKESQPPELPPKTGSRKNEIAKVLAPYQATGRGQLSLNIGQLIMIRKKNDSGWWEGELQARGKKRQIGWFPANYVSLMAPSKTGTLPKTLSSPVPSEQRLTPGLEVICQVITVYPYAKTKEDEISFQKGMVINVMGKEEGEWWKGELNGATGLFPSNYVQELKDSGRTVPSDDWTKDISLLENTPETERKRQERIHELITTEEKYVTDLMTAIEVFYKPLEKSDLVSSQDLAIIFVNWKDIIQCNTKLLKAFRVRKKMSGLNQPIHTIGDILCEQLTQFAPYIRFCSRQLTASGYLHKKLQSNENFNQYVKQLGTDLRTAGMPLSSSLIKPMQRITKYPLLIQKILKYTPESHSDYVTTRNALEKAEVLCNQVNEGVREGENSERLEWLQTHVECEGLAEELVFNSLTNCLGPRKYLHSKKVNKVKSNKELCVFLFNDFLLFTQPVKPGQKPFVSLGNQKVVEFKMYKQPLFLNEVQVNIPEDIGPEDAIFHIVHGERVYALRCDSKKDVTKWQEAIVGASQNYIETDKRKREKAQKARAERTKGVGRLMVVIIQGNDLKASNGVTNTSDPYCIVTMGGQENKTKVVLQNLNPVWDSSMQFIIRDLQEELLCITVYDKDLFTPDDYLGRTEVRVSDIHKETQGRGPLTKNLLLHEVETGEISIKLNLHLFED